MTQQIQSLNPAPAVEKMSYEEFLEWDGENQHVEWMEGEVIAMAPIGDRHQDLGRVEGK